MVRSFRAITAQMQYIQKVLNTPALRNETNSLRPFWGPGGDAPPPGWRLGPDSLVINCRFMAFTVAGHHHRHHRAHTRRAVF